MNISTFSLILAFLLRDAETVFEISARKTALTLVYYEPAQNYFVTDLDQAQLINDASLKIGFTPAFRFFILCCGVVDGDSKNTFTSKVHQLAIKFEKLPEQRVCELQPSPTLINTEVADMYNIGYSIDKDTEQMTRMNLPPFENTQNGLARFPIIRIKFHPITLTTYETQHTFFLYQHSNRAVTPCNKFEESLHNRFASEHTTSTSMNIEKENFFKAKHLKTILNNMEEPTVCQSNNDSIVTKLFNCVKITFAQTPIVKHQLTPIEDFNDKMSRAATCFSANIVPIWLCISTGPLKQVEKFIRNIAHELPMNTIHVRTIAYGVLQMKRKDDGQWQHIYLNPTDLQLPIPQMVIKIITYRMPLTFEQRDLQPIERHIAIVVLNDFNAINSKTEICHKDICTEAGLFISGDQSEREYFFCCNLKDPKFQSILNELEIPIVSDQVLDLVRIPKKLDADGNVSDWIDISQRV